MKAQSFKIEIGTSCEQVWDQMEKVPSGFYCQDCTKAVRDFTAMSDEELIAVFTQKRSGELCGRFSAEQLQKTYMPKPEPAKASPAWKLLLAGLLAMEFPLAAQSPALSHAVPAGHSKLKSPQPGVSQPDKFLRGLVSGRGTRQAAVVNVLLYSGQLDNTLLYTTRTDSAGHYDIKLPFDSLDRFFRVVFSDEGFQERSIVVDKYKLPYRLNVAVQPLVCVEVVAAPVKNLDEVIIYSQAVKWDRATSGLAVQTIVLKPSLWRRIKYKVKRLFKRKSRG